MSRKKQPKHRYNTIRRRNLDDQYREYGGVAPYIRHLIENKKLTYREIAADVVLSLRTIHKYYRESLALPAKPRTERDCSETRLPAESRKIQRETREESEGFRRLETHVG